MNLINKILIAMLLGCGAVLSSCEGNLADLNIDPNNSNVMTYDAQLLRIELYTSNSSDGLITYMNGAAIQHLASLFILGGWGDKYFRPKSVFVNGSYNNRYLGSVKNVVDLIARTSEDPDDVNFYNIARILRAFIFHRITDFYGDVPYSEAGQGFLSDNISPIFDTQQSIYLDMLNELSAAASALDASKATYGTSDVLYSGDLDQWRKMAYSLMLRLAMRMQKVEPELAEKWAKTAVNGGVFTSNADNMIVKHAIGANENNNGFNSALVGGTNDHRISNTLVDLLTNTGDPRLNIYTEPFDGSSWPQKGLPNGLDASTIGDSPGGGDYDSYAWFNRTLVTPLDAPRILMTYSEIALLQAEAVTRDWITGDATALYEAGVAAGMQQWEVYAGIVVPDLAEIAIYLAATPFDGSLEMIGTQIWLTNFINFHEAFSHWRRTGYPILVPVNYPGNETNGTIPRRMYYSETELNVNTENYNAAVARQGPDNYTTRIWWDVN